MTHDIFNRGRQILHILLDTCSSTTLQRRATEHCQARARVPVTDEVAGVERMQSALSAAHFERLAAELSQDPSLGQKLDIVKFCNDSNGEDMMNVVIGNIVRIVHAAN
jgi:hypothetical protein